MGGGLYGLMSKASCTRSTFKGNHAVHRWWPVHTNSRLIGSNPELHLMDGEVSGNTADSQGGGIYSVGEGEVADPRDP